MLKRLSKLTLFLCLFGFSDTLGESYQPDMSPSLADPSFWRELEPLHPYNLKSGAEALDGTLYFATENAILIYDGYKCEEYPFPENDQEHELFELFASKNGLIYAIGDQGLFTVNDGDFKIIVESESSSTNNHRHFATSPYGVEIAKIGNKVYRINGYDIDHLAAIDHPVSGISFDHKNRLWTVVPSANALSSYQFERSALKQPLERKLYNLEKDGNENFVPKIISSPYYGGVWSVNERANQRHHRYVEETDSWIPFDLTKYSGANSHVLGFIPAADELVIFSKTSLIYHANNQWHTISGTDFNPPINRPFIISRRNGNLIFGGYGEKTYETLYSKQNYINYTGLHFQCDGYDKSQWFISIEGDVIQRSADGLTWTRHTENAIDAPLTIIRANDGSIWTSGAHRGVAAVSYFDGNSWTRNTHPELGDLISHLSAYQMKDGRILFGSGAEFPSDFPGGAIVYQKIDETYRATHIKSHFLSGRPVTFVETNDGLLWTGGTELRNTDPHFSKKASVYAPFAQERWIDHIANDDEGNLWIALWDKGLYHNVGKEWVRVKAPEQIASDQVAYILNDNTLPNNLWVATDKGISRYDGERWHPLALPKSTRFNREGGTLRQSDDGALWINLADRNWHFRQNSNFHITKNLYNSFKTIRHYLDTEAPIAKIYSPTLEYTSPANIFVEWQGTDRWSRTSTSELKFSYQIDDEPWSAFAKKKSNIFLDVPAGDHSIKVRAMDRDGNISATAAATNATVIPPMWLRAWFIALVAITLITIAILIAFIFKQHIRHIAKIEEFKLQFFTNISHELRTPLTVILGPLESHLAKMSASEDKKPLQLAYKNARKTLALIDQLLDFRSAQTNKITLNPSHGDLVESIRESIDLIRPLALDQSQQLAFESNAQSCLAWFDSEKLDRIISNLVSNAIKYTEKNGSISVRLAITESDKNLSAEIIVEDNGSGIPSGKIDNIFEVFYRASNTPKKKVRGSGIGLAYTKNLVQAFEGSIEVESPITTLNGKRQGTRFTVSLPLKKYQENGFTTPASAQTPPSLAANKSQDRKRPCILIAEDDQDIREFLSGELAAEYEIITAENGEAATSLATDLMPDLILTDIMMPQLDGKALCRLTKTNPLTSHIPVIMLTALKSNKHELEGLEHGADDYLAKPIRIPILKQRIRNQLDLLRAQHEKFTKNAQKPGSLLQNVTRNSLDEKLLNQALSFIEANIEDPLLDVEGLAKELGMSRMTLYRKLKAITGKSPSQFIRSIRMQRAIELLESKAYTVSEIGYKVGFSDLSSFSATFKKQLGASPSEYANTPKNNREGV